jgi:hypothetical protein
MPAFGRFADAVRMIIEQRTAGRIEGRKRARVLTNANTGLYKMKVLGPSHQFSIGFGK